MDFGKPRNRCAERPWTRLDCLKNAFKKAATDIEAEHKTNKAKAEDSLPILIAVAHLMDKPIPDVDNFRKLGMKLDRAKVIGEEWLEGKYSSAEIKLQEAMRQATLEDINKEIARLENTRRRRYGTIKIPHRAQPSKLSSKTAPGLLGRCYAVAGAGRQWKPEIHHRTYGNRRRTLQVLGGDLHQRRP
jgi:hypothetical protein